MVKRQRHHTAVFKSRRPHTEEHSVHRSRQTASCRSEHNASVWMHLSFSVSLSSHWGQP